MLFQGYGLGVYNGWVGTPELATRQLVAKLMKHDICPVYRYNAFTVRVQYNMDDEEQDSRRNRYGLNHVTGLVV